MVGLELDHLDVLQTTTTTQLACNAAAISTTVCLVLNYRQVLDAVAEMNYSLICLSGSPSSVRRALRQQNVTTPLSQRARRGCTA